MRTDFEMYVLLAGVVALVALVVLAARAGKRAGPPPATWPEPPPPTTPSPAAPSPQWHALPGLRLELGATGYCILLGTRPMEPLYRLISPEGYVSAFGIDLPGLKGLGERLASERAEFERFGAGAAPTSATLQQLRSTAR